MKKSILFLFFFGGIMSESLLAQEVRIQGNIAFLGYIDDPFIGAGVGIEAPLGQHFSMNVDGNWGSHEKGSLLELRPAISYYFGMEQQGLFVGAAFKYISLSEKNQDSNSWEDNLYSIGFNLGYKTMMDENWTLALVASPHKTISGHAEGDVAGISAQLALGYRL